ncbi:hypothetical protein F4860DRAFT_463074 [Xylaria cubensis]|nr:hypothetical protein F4860DRAFT_463074 [Xylaria cubensis]
MKPTGVLMIGSVPGTSPTEVFTRLTTALPRRLEAVPDGETGERWNYIGWQRECFPRLALPIESGGLQPTSESPTFALADIKPTGYDEAALSSYMFDALSRTFNGSRSTSGTDTKASDRQSRKERSDRGEFTQLSELPLRRAPSVDSMDPLHQGYGNVSSFAAGSASERGMRDGIPPSRIVIKKEIVQMVQ